MHLLIKKISGFVFGCKFFQFLSSKPWIRIQICIQLKMLDPDPKQWRSAPTLRLCLCRGFEEPKSAPLQPGMSLEEVEQRQQQQQQVSDHQQRALSRASDKDSGAHAPNAAASSSRILTDFLKAGRGGTPAAAVDGQAALPAGLLEAIMGGVGGQGSTGVGETVAGGFNFDSIMMESVIDLSSLLGGSSQNARNGGEMSGDLKNSGAPLRSTAQAQQQQQVSPQQQQPEQQQQQQSRFSQFFSKPQPEPAPAAQAAVGGSRRSSIQEELTSSGASILRELNGGAPATIRIPSPEEEGGSGASSKYFTPISPAAKTGGPPPR